MSEIKDAIGAERYEEFRALLQATFHGSLPPDDATVDGFVRTFVRQHPAEARQMGIGELPPEPPPEPGTPDHGGHRYPLYTALATHHRVRAMTEKNLGAKSDAPFESEFVGRLPMVRVSLPQSNPPASDPVIKTQIGDVRLGTDHLAGSIEFLTQQFGAKLGYKPGRVDLITPARTGVTNSRFGAIAVYLGYRNAKDPGPSFYMFEGGMATGEPKVLYFSPDINKPIKQMSGYHPTAYSSEHNEYEGHVVMKGDELFSMFVQGVPKGSPYYIQISVQYVPKTDTANDPTGLLLEAAKRIALIGQNMGVPSGVPFQSILAGAGGDLVWVQKPKYGGSGTIPGDRDFEAK